MKIWGGIDYKIIVACSGSSDETCNIVDSFSKVNSNIIRLDTKYKEHGPKLVALYKCALDNEADYVFQTDSDGQTDPDDFYDFWNDRKKYDAIFGNRIKREDGIIRAFVEKCLCCILLFIFRVNVPDANAPFRLMNSKVLEKYIKNIPDDYVLTNVLLTVYFKRKEVVCFKNISFSSRQKGENSIDLIKIIKIGIKSIIGFCRIRKNVLYG